jgi:glycine cleavage system pyridoxal-binding protein P
VLKSFIGQGYYGTHTPGVILRNILENPAWYTAYTPYQAEISQGRMEALVNFQTMVCDLTGMPIANASMLDEATAAAEAMTLAKRSVKSKSNVFVVAGDCHPQTIEVIQTRAAPLGIEVRWPTRPKNGTPCWTATTSPCWPNTPPPAAALTTCAPTWKRRTRKQARLHRGADLLALTLLVPPGEWGADIVVGTTQRFGMPMGAGGPHAAYLACRDEFKRSMPGRLVGVSVDVHGNPAYRLALQTREQHIRREKATSNICTAQVLPAVVASMYAVYHGPQGLRASPSAWPATPPSWRAAWQQLGHRCAQQASAFDTLAACKTGRYAINSCSRGPAMGANLRIYFENTCACRWTRPPRAPTWSCCGRSSPKTGRPCPRSTPLKRAWSPDSRRVAPHQRLPHAPGVQHAPLRNRHAALHPRAVRQGPGAGPQHDPAGQLHHEAQRHQRDDSHHLAGIRQRAPVCPADQLQGYAELDAAAARLAVPGHGLRRHQPAAQRRQPGRIRRPAGHQGLPRERGAKATATSA